MPLRTAKRHRRDTTEPLRGPWIPASDRFNTEPPGALMTDFVHLHVHSHYTLLESPITPKVLLQAVAAKGMDTVALTDRSNLFGALEIQQISDKPKGPVCPLIGAQVNVAPLGMQERTRDMLQLVLLVKSRAGYKALTELVSLAWLEGFYYEPRIDLDLLRAKATDLICLTGAGQYGFLNYHLGSGAMEEAARQADLLREIFGEDLYVELCDFGTEESANLVRDGKQLAADLGLPVVATAWVHYLEQSDADVHDVQLAVQKVTTLSDRRRRRMPSDQFYLKTPEEMAALYADCPEAISNTRKIADACKDATVETGVYHLPVFECPDSVDRDGYLASFEEEEYRQRYQVDPKGKPRNLTDAQIRAKQIEDAYLTELCQHGMHSRYDTITQVHHERLAFELQTITRMGFSAYFLIVQDFINWAKESGIPVGPGRGSAAGSLVAFSLGITDMCPLRYGLLFERFLNPGRISMPDIDIDFCKDGRGRVIEYTAQKYGREAVTQIMTLGTMKARLAIKDVSRAYEWSPEEAQDLANLVPEDPSGKHTIAVCLGKASIKGKEDPSPKMQARYAGDERSRQVLDTAMRIENLGRSLGVHACGVIIAPGPVHQYVPVCQVKSKPATQYNMVQVEDCGLLKMDFLGLKTMSILKKAADIVQAVDGKTIDFPSLPLDNSATFRLLGEGRTLGVFQCESTGFQELIKMLKPDRFEDLIALVALYRPGPLQNGMHISYCNRKHGLEEVTYPHPVLEQILKETYGLYIYQEQIMNISRELSGFSPSDADNLRKAMGKKKEDVLNKMKPAFVEGAFERHGFPREKSEEMWATFIAFASYCFNKSHSACYGLIAYWTAYMKANHFEAFMTANLIYEMGNKDKMTLFIQELRSHNVDVLPPDVNESGWEFTWTGKAIRFGFGGIKGVGQGAAEHLMQKRQEGEAFEDLYHLIERIDTRAVNKRVIEHLVKVGALDSLHNNRRALAETIERAFERAGRVHKSRLQNQATLFGMFEQEDTFRQETQGYQETDDWGDEERLAFEKQLTGYWMSGHPLHAHRESVAPYVSHASQDLARNIRGKLCLAAVIIEKREIKTRTGKMMCILTLEDEHARFEAVLFGANKDRRGNLIPGAFERFAHECDVNMVALFTGKIDSRNKNQNQNRSSDADADPALDEEAAPERLPSLIVEEIVPVQLMQERLTELVQIRIDADADDSERLQRTQSLLRENPGNCPIQALMQTPAEVLLTVNFGQDWCIHPAADVLQELQEIWGPNRIITRIKQTAKPALDDLPEEELSPEEVMEY